MIKELVDEIIKDGRVDEQEVSVLEYALQAGGISLDTAGAMIDINNKTSNNHPMFNALYVGVVTDVMLGNTEGILTEEAGDYLVDKFQEDGEIDYLEKATIYYLAFQAEEIKSDRFKTLLESI